MAESYADGDEKKKASAFKCILNCEKNNKYYAIIKQALGKTHNGLDHV